LYCIVRAEAEVLNLEAGQKQQGWW